MVNFYKTNRQSLKKAYTEAGRKGAWNRGRKTFIDEDMEEGRKESRREAERKTERKAEQKAERKVKGRQSRRHAIM